MNAACRQDTKKQSAAVKNGNPPMRYLHLSMSFAIEPYYAQIHKKRTAQRGSRSSIKPVFLTQESLQLCQALFQRGDLAVELADAGVVILDFSRGCSLQRLIFALGALISAAGLLILSVQRFQLCI